MHLLPEEFNPSNIFIRSSYVERCVESAASFMEGMYPIQKGNETLNITTGNRDNEPLSIYMLKNDETIKLGIEYMKTPEMVLQKEKTLKIQKPLIESLGIRELIHMIG